MNTAEVRQEAVEVEFVGDDAEAGDLHESQAAAGAEVAGGQQVLQGARHAGCLLAWLHKGSCTGHTTRCCYK